MPLVISQVQARSYKATNHNILMESLESVGLGPISLRTWKELHALHAVRKSSQLERDSGEPQIHLRIFFCSTLQDLHNSLQQHTHLRWALLPSVSAVQVHEASLIVQRICSISYET